MSLETQLRETILSHADAAPAGAGLLDSVRQRHKRFRRRRRRAVTAGLAAVVAVAMIGPGLVGDLRHGPAPGYAPSTLVTPDFAMPYFPYEITWMPPGAGKIRAGFSAEIGATAFALLEDGYVYIAVGDHPEPLSVSSSPTEQTNTVVGGHPATQHTDQHAFGDDEPRVALFWQQDGRWITVESRGSANVEADVKRIGESLRPGRVEIFNPIKLRLAPEGWVVSGVGSSSREERRAIMGGTQSPAAGEPTATHHTLCLSRSAVTTNYATLCVQADREESVNLAKDSRATKVTVNGGEGWMVRDEESELRVEFSSGGWFIEVVQAQRPRMADEDVIRFAEGISIVES